MRSPSTAWLILVHTGTRERYERLPTPASAMYWGLGKQHPHRRVYGLRRLRRMALWRWRAAQLEDARRDA